MWRQRLNYYGPDDLATIVRRSAGILGVPIDGRRRSSRSPGARAGHPVSPTACCAACATSPRSMADGRVTAEVAHESLLRLEVDERGLDEMDRRIMEAVIRQVRRRAGRCEEPGRGGGRGGGDHRGDLRAVPHPGGSPQAHAARGREATPGGVRVLRGSREPGEQGEARCYGAGATDARRLTASGAPPHQTHCETMRVLLHICCGPCAHRPDARASRRGARGRGRVRQSEHPSLP